MNINAITPQELQQLRLRLLANGWTPLANVDKRCMLHGWPTLEVDATLIDWWSRKQKRLATTGVRMDGDLVVADFDVDDAEAMKEIANAVFDAYPRLADPSVPLLQRTGKGAKEAWFFRSDDAFRYLHSRAWTRPGEGPDDGAHRVEIFGPSATRQFGAFGPHTVADDGSIAVEYGWVERSPADTRQSELPVLAKAELNGIIDIAERTLQRLGWSPVPLSTAGENEASRVYDLTHDMHFDINTGERLSLRELRQRAQAMGVGDGTELRCSASWIEPGSVNRTRCIVRLDDNDRLRIWESATDVNHYEAEVAPPERGTDVIGLSALGAKLKALGIVPATPVPAVPELSVNDTAGRTAEKLLELYAHCTNSAFPEVLRVVTNKAGDGMDLSRFQRAMSKYNRTERRGDEQVVRKPAAMWLASSQRKDVAGSVLRPDMPVPIFREGGRQWINTYYRPVHDAAPEGEAEFDAFMEHLVPDADERAYVLRMDAYKWLHPEVPGVTILMVAERQGAGRGTYFSMLHGIYGSYAVKLDSSTMSSGSGQGQYNDYLAGSLIATCDEVLVAGAASDKHRRYAYEQFKKNFETGAMMRRIIQKGRQNYDAMVFTSMRLATNHDDAMPIEDDDRRVANIRNGVPLIEAPAVKAGIDRFRPNGNFTPGFLAMLARKWEAMDLTGFRSDGAVPAFEGRAIMIASNRTDADDIVEDLLEKKGDYVSLSALRASTDREVTLPEIKAALKRLGWVKTTPGRDVYGSTKVRAHIYARNAAAKRKWAGVTYEERRELVSLFKSPAEALSDRLNERGMSVIDGGLDDEDDK